MVTPAMLADDDPLTLREACGHHHLNHQAGAVSALGGDRRKA